MGSKSKKKQTKVSTDQKDEPRDEITDPKAGTRLEDASTFLKDRTDPKEPDDVVPEVKLKPDAKTVGDQPQPANEGKDTRHAIDKNWAPEPGVDVTSKSRPKDEVQFQALVAEEVERFAIPGRSPPSKVQDEHDSVEVNDSSQYGNQFFFDSSELSALEKDISRASQSIVTVRYDSSDHSPVHQLVYQKRLMADGVLTRRALLEDNTVRIVNGAKVSYYPVVGYQWGIDDAITRDLKDVIGYPSISQPDQVFESVNGAFLSEVRLTQDLDMSPKPFSGVIRSPNENAYQLISEDWFTSLLNHGKDLIAWSVKAPEITEITTSHSDFRKDKVKVIANGEVHRLISGMSTKTVRIITRAINDLVSTTPPAGVDIVRLDPRMTYYEAQVASRTTLHNGDRLDLRIIGGDNTTLVVMTKNEFQHYQRRLLEFYGSIPVLDLAERYVNEGVGGAYFQWDLAPHVNPVVYAGAEGARLKGGDYPVYVDRVALETLVGMGFRGLDFSEALTKYSPNIPHYKGVFKEASLFQPLRQHANVKAQDVNFLASVGLRTDLAYSGFEAIKTFVTSRRGWKIEAPSYVNSEVHACREFLMMCVFIDPAYIINKWSWARVAGIDAFDIPGRGPELGQRARQGLGYLQAAGVQPQNLLRPNDTWYSLLERLFTNWMDVNTPTVVSTIRANALGAVTMNLHAGLAHEFQGRAALTQEFFSYSNEEYIAYFEQSARNVAAMYFFQALKVYYLDQEARRMNNIRVGSLTENMLFRPERLGFAQGYLSIHCTLAGLSPLRFPPITPDPFYHALSFNQGAMQSMALCLGNISGTMKDQLREIRGNLRSHMLRYSTMAYSPWSDANRAMNDLANSAEYEIRLAAELIEKSRVMRSGPHRDYQETALFKMADKVCSPFGRIIVDLLLSEWDRMTPRERQGVLLPSSDIIPRGASMSYSSPDTLNYLTNLPLPTDRFMVVPGSVLQFKNVSPLDDAHPGRGSKYLSLTVSEVPPIWEADYAQHEDVTEDEYMFMRGGGVIAPSADEYAKRMAVIPRVIEFPSSVQPRAFAVILLKELASIEWSGRMMSTTDHGSHGRYPEVHSLELLMLDEPPADFNMDICLRHLHYLIRNKWFVLPPLEYSHPESYTSVVPELVSVYMNTSQYERYIGDYPDPSEYIRGPSSV